MSQRVMVPYAQQGNPFGVLRGPVHQARALARKMERRGDIRILGQGVTYPDGARLLIAIPYVPLRTDLAERHRRRVLTLAGAGVLGSGLLVGIGAALWHLRFVIMGAGGAVLTMAFLFWLFSRIGHAGSCPGLHCPGCRR